MALTILEIELPSVYLDSLIEDAATTVVGKTPVLINLEPNAGDTRVAAATYINLDIATLDVSGTIDLANTKIYVNGTLAFNGGTFQTGFNGLGSAYSNPQADVLRVVVCPTSNFASEQVVSVRVVSNATSDTAHVLDQTYTFTIVDYAPPQLVSATAHDLQTVRLHFNEDVNEDDASDTASALDPANYTIYRLGDYLTPLVSAKVVSCAAVTTADVDITTDIPLTPGGAYRITALSLQDTSGNAIIAPNNTTDFTAWTPPIPEGRDFDLYGKLPQLNRTEDQDSQDLLRFTGCLQEVLGLLLYDIDRFTDILDPDTAPEEVVDLMLLDLGNPFAFDLDLEDKRRLAQILVNIYMSKGTAPGIIDVVRFFLGIEITIDVFNTLDGMWILGESELGFDTVLATTDSHTLYSFNVIVQQTLTDTQRAQIHSIVDYMKPAHTHFQKLVEPTIPSVINHLELGLSELGVNWLLH